MGKLSLMGMLYLSQSMLHPLGDGEYASFPLVDYFERNMVICETILGCPLTHEQKVAWSKEKDEEAKFKSGVQIAKQPNLMADGDQGLHSYVPRPKKKKLLQHQIKDSKTISLNNIRNE